MKYFTFLLTLPDISKRTPALVALCLLALAGQLSAEPLAGPYLLAVATISDADGIKGPQLGILAGGRVQLFDSITLLFEGQVLHSPKLDAGDGYLVGAILDVEHWWHAWYVAAGISWAIQETSSYSKEARAPRLTIGRQGPFDRISITWRPPDSTPDHLQSLGLDLEYRPRRWILRTGVAWLRHRAGDGLRFSWATGLTW